MKNGIIKVMAANIINLIVGILTSFLLPKFLPVESYAIIKTYALYITYAGFFSLGYNDGMYLKYGGKKITELSKDGFANNFINYFFIILIMTIIVLTIGIIFSNSIIIAFAFGIFSYNILGYLKSLYQATGEFGAYGKALNFEKIAIFVISMFFIFVLHKENGNFYVWIQVIVGIVISIYLTIRLNSVLKFINKGKISLTEIISNVKSGFILMLGNFSSGIFTGLDRWFIKILLTDFNFAMYSFAVSMENIVNTFTTPITISMYNYFCKNSEVNKIIKIKKYVLIWGIFIISLAYPAKFILEIYLQKYKQSNNIIFLLFGAQLFYLIIKGIYVNIYKTEKKQNKYLIQMLEMIGVGFILNLILFRIFKSMESIAVATLITSIIWLIICEGEKNNAIRFSINEILTIFVVISVYLLTGYYCNSISGLCIYYACSFGSIFIFMKDTLFDIFNELKKLFFKCRGKDE